MYTNTGEEQRLKENEDIRGVGGTKKEEKIQGRWGDEFRVV